MAREERYDMRYGQDIEYPFFFFNDTATTEIYTLSLHDALPISAASPVPRRSSTSSTRCCTSRARARSITDRKSTRLNSSHLVISYAVFCLKKKNSNTPVTDDHGSYWYHVSTATEDRHAPNEPTR